MSTVGQCDCVLSRVGPMLHYGMQHCTGLSYPVKMYFFLELNDLDTSCVSFEDTSIKIANIMMLSRRPEKESLPSTSSIFSS